MVVPWGAVANPSFHVANNYLAGGLILDSVVHVAGSDGPNSEGGRSCLSNAFYSSD